MTVVVSVVAVLRAKPGLGPQVIQSFSTVSPLVHAEHGCEFYAAHLQQVGDTVVMVERWSTKEDLDAHASGAPLTLLRQLNEGLLIRPYDVWKLDAVPLGDLSKGTIRAGAGGG